MKQNKNANSSVFENNTGSVNPVDLANAVNSKLDEKINSGVIASGSDVTNLSSQLDELGKQVSKITMKPYFIDGFSTFNRFGLGEPSGIANYTGGNYVLRVNGNIGDTFVTVVSGNISHAGGIWSCVIEDNNGIYNLNKVISINGSKLNLIEPLKTNLVNTRLGNLHDAVQGQHYTELGYFAFAQHIYNSNPHFCQRDKYIAKFRGTDSSGQWKNNGYMSYGGNGNIVENTTNMFIRYGTKYLSLNCTTINNYLEWEVDLSSKKGYVEAFIGSSNGTKLTVELYLDNVLANTQEVSYLNRVVFGFNNAIKGKIKVKPASDVSTSFGINIGNVTWWESYSDTLEHLIEPFKKPSYLGDSWGEFSNKATSRELTRLLGREVKDYSKHAHSAVYAKVWFDEYIVKNGHDCVIIEYFTNDFNSYRGTDLGTVVAPDGSLIDMNVKSIVDYENNLKWLIDRAIENGIQPIVLCPFSTNSLTQTQAFSDYANQVWQGESSVAENIAVKSIISNSVETQNISSKSDEDIKIVGKAVNSSSRKGVIIDSDRKLTGGYIAQIHNNSEKKVGITYDGAVEVNFSMFLPQQYNPAMTNEHYGKVYLFQQSGQDDQLRIVIKKSDGTIVTKKIQLID